MNLSTPILSNIESESLVERSNEHEIRSPVPEAALCEINHFPIALTPAHSEQFDFSKHRRHLIRYFQDSKHALTN